MSVATRQLIRILELLAPETDGLRVTDLAEAMGTNRAIPHRHLATLMDLGYVEQIAGTERYRTTYRLGALGLRTLERSGLLDWAQEHLDGLARRTNELARLGVVENDSLIWVVRSQGSNSSLIIDPSLGAHAQLHATASGKAYLSTLSPDRAASLLRKADLKPLTPLTETDPDLVMAEVEIARKKGYAIVDGEMAMGVSAIAAPVVAEPRSAAVATVHIAGPSVRLDPETLESFADAVIDTARAIAAEWPVYHYMKRAQGQHA